MSNLQLYVLVISVFTLMFIHREITWTPSVSRSESKLKPENTLVINFVASINHNARIDKPIYPGLSFLSAISIAKKNEIVGLQENMITKWHL